MKQNKYTWEFNETDFWSKSAFNTIEECIEDCKNYCLDYGFPFPITIQVGEIKLYTPIVDADWLLEQLYEQAYDDVGELAEDWCAECTEYKEIDELSNQLTEIVNKWLKKNGNEPNFYHIKNVKEIKINERLF